MCPKKLHTTNTKRSAEVKTIAQGKSQESSMSALDAAAKLLSESSEPLNCKQLVEGIAAKGYWQSPKGKTPHSTLYASIQREIGTKGASSRFTKAGPGKFSVTKN